MRKVALLSAAACLGLALVLVSGLSYGKSAQNKDKPKAKDSIAALIEQLGDDEFDKREEAAEKLEELGEKALPALIEAAATTKDLEIRKRANKLIGIILPKTNKSKSIGLALARIDAGQFAMGSEKAERDRKADETQHTVRITRPFYLGAYEVTQDEYDQVMKLKPSWFSATGDGKDSVRGQDTDRYPVERVTWYDAAEFCNRLSKKDGFDLCYKLEDVKKDGDSIIKAKVTIIRANGYRLPSEAEWEFACRSGSKTAWNFGVATKQGDLNAKPLIVSIGYGSGPKWPELKRTTKVGSHKPNLWGVYDMHGNVAEWCNDWYGKDYYDDSPKDDPKGPDKGDHRVVRGGSWLVTEGSCRSASRASQAPDEGKYYAGFRVARSP